MHLVNYEEAGGDIQKALAAIEVSCRKNSRSRAWTWAEVASDHAFAAGINKIDLGNGRYPNVDQLEADLIKKEANSGLSQLCVCDFPDGTATVAQREKMEGHYNEAGGFCCPHHGNTCGHCHQYN